MRNKSLKEKVELNKEILLSLLKSLADTTNDFTLKKNCEFFINQLLDRPNC